MDRWHRLWRWSWVLVGTLAGLAVLAGLVLAVWKLPSLLYGDVTRASPDARLQAASSFRTALVAGLAGLAALGSLATAARTYRLTQQGQLTERYTKATEQLGSDKLDVRLGGIYALERIAVDSRRDHPTVVEVLGAFVRERGQPTTQPSPGTADDGIGEPTTPPARPKPPTDVQAAVTVLGRLPRRKDVFRGGLYEAHLEGAILYKAHLEGVNLYETHLEGAILDEAHLEGAILFGAHLERATLDEAHLEGAHLTNTHLEGATLKGAHLKGALLAYTHLEGADLLGAHGLVPRELDEVFVDERTRSPTGRRLPPGTSLGPAGEQT